MDPAFHIVSGVIIAKTVSGDHLLAGAVMANLPDLISLPYAYIIKIRLARKDTLAHFITDFKRFEQSGISVDPRVMRIYHGVHNVWFWIIITGVLWLVVPDIALMLSLCLLSHLLTDVPSHEKDYASRPLYPFIQTPIQWGKNWTRSKGVFFGSWAVLLLIAYVVFR